MPTPPTERGNRPRILIVEDDPDMVRRILTGIGRRCCDVEAMAARDMPAGGLISCACADSESYQACCTLVRSLLDLHEFDLSSCDLVICASGLPDGSGLDALAFVRGMSPDLPVMLTGDSNDTPLAVEAIRAGAADFLVKSENDFRTLRLTIEKCLAQQRIKRENERLQMDLSRSLAETAVKNRQLQALIHQLETMARTDELTNLCNRRWLNLTLERVWAESLRSGRPLAFVMIDLDGFKGINDEFGHQFGDDILRLAGKVIEANCRGVDHAARYGGDEFCILMPDTEPHEAAIVTQRILEAFTDAIRHRADCHNALSMSIGVSHVSVSQPKNSTQLIAHADEALYAAKAEGKNRIKVRGAAGAYTPGPDGHPISIGETSASFTPRHVA